ncbi:MAG: sigma-70 family RNA polymerase sigma factor [Rudaea sp.]|nr:sigma-70 family RNA polymerase sigma factor [Rudaea sp.]
MFDMSPMNPGTTSTWVSELAQQHLDAAYNLGRWLLGNPQDAADAVHDAYLRAARSAHTYAGGNARAWWLAIVRNCCLAKLSSRRRETQLRSLDAASATAALHQTGNNDVEDRAHGAQCNALIAEHLRALPAEFREALILREIEDLSYREIADVLQVPIGTVMSRLARGRTLLQRALASTPAQEQTHGL